MSQQATGATTKSSRKRILSDFVQNDGRLLVLQGVEISEEICSALEERDTSFQNAQLKQVTGNQNLVGRLLQSLVLLDQDHASGCSRLALHHPRITLANETLEDAAEGEANIHLMRILGASLASVSCQLRYLDITTDFGFVASNKPKINNNGLSEQIETAVSLLADGLSRNQHVKVLRLEECHLRDDHAASIVTALRTHPSLQNLCLSGNRCGTQTSTAVSNLLRETDCKLQLLYLDMSSSSYMGNRRPKLNISELASALRINRSLQRLDLTSNCINDDDLNCLGRTMIPNSSDATGTTTFNSTLTCLALGRNRITEAGLSVLLYQILPHVRGNLRTLALRGNLIDDLSTSPITGEEGWGQPKILKNRVIKAMLDLEDIELLRAVSLPEQVPVDKWPLLLSRLQRTIRCKPAVLGCNSKPLDLLYLVLRGPVLSVLGRSGSFKPCVSSSARSLDWVLPKSREKDPTWKISARLLIKECAENANPYLRNFASSPLAAILLKDDRVASCFCRRNRSTIRKELVEAAALETRVKRIFKSASNTPNSEGHETMVIWDLCSGKGYSAVWLSANAYPTAQIHMVDTDSKANRSFLAAFPNIRYHNLDLYSAELEALIVKSVRQAKSSRVILAGIHLCGDLSRRVLELQSRCGTDATFLSPCCAMRPVSQSKQKLGSFGYDVPRQARRLKVVTPYELWCWMLWGYAIAAPSSASRRLDLACDPCMKSDKNAWLTVVDQKDSVSKSKN